MISKEALELLRLKFIEHNNEFDYSVIEFNNDIDRFNIVEKDLDRLEKLEKVVKIIKEIIPIQFLGYNEHGAKPYEVIINGRVIGLYKEKYNLLKEVFNNE